MRISFVKSVCVFLLLIAANYLFMATIMHNSSFERLVEQADNFSNDTDPILLRNFMNIKCEDFINKNAETENFTVNDSSSQCYMDQSGKYKFQSFAVSANKWRIDIDDSNINSSISNSKIYDDDKNKLSTVDGRNILCLSSQTSVDKLHLLVDQARTWSGPMSISVFVPDVDYTIAVLMITALRSCSKPVRQNVDFHMAYPVDMPPVFRPTNDEVLYICSDLKQHNTNLINSFRSNSFKKAIAKTKYPQNLLRNMARDRGLSVFSFTPDFDMISRPGMYENLLTFLTSTSASDCDRCAFIIPVYEIATGERNPVNKTELLRYLKSKKAQRFHQRVFSPNQANSNLSCWEILDPQFHEGIHVMYNITLYKEYWEPVYITRMSTSLPKFNENFVGYGSTRNSQVLEMELAGYKWSLLDNAFLSHEGFQTKKGRSPYRTRQIVENTRKYRVFKQKVLEQYGANISDPKFGVRKKKTQNNPTKL